MLYRCDFELYVLTSCNINIDLKTNMHIHIYAYYLQNYISKHDLRIFLI